MISGDTALEKAIEIARKAGWSMIWVTEVKRENNNWIVRLEAFLRKLVVVLGPEGELVGFREETEVRAS